MKLPYNFVMVFSLAASVSLASCSVARRVHTAKSAAIACQITQMPTVAELEVLPEQVKADVSWVNHTFKGSIPRKAQEQTLIARILAGAQADVLVEPKISHESHRRWFRTDHSLSVSGYPARYKAFRTASEEDIAKIRAMREPASPPAPVMQVETLRPEAQDTPDKTSSVADTGPVEAPAERPQRKFQRRTGYRGYLDGGYLSIENQGMRDGYGFTTTHGCQIFQQLFIGAGAGFYAVSAHEEEFGYGDKAHFVPAFLAVRSDLLKRRLTPYVEGRVGYEFVDAKALFVSGGAGVSIGHIDIGAEYVHLGGDRCNTGAFRLRLGLSF